MSKPPVTYKWKCLMCADEVILPDPPGPCARCGGELTHFNYWYESRSAEREAEKVAEVEEEEEETEEKSE